MTSLVDEIDKFYHKFEDKISYSDFRKLCLQIHGHHTKQYLIFIFGKQNKTHDIIGVYSRHIAFHVRRVVKKNNMNSFA